MINKCILLLLIVCVVQSQSATIEEEVRNSTKFTIDWYKSSFNANQNTVVSPISFRILLSLLYHSTILNTEYELRNYVYFSEKYQTGVSQGLTLNQLMRNPNIKVVNRVYVQQGYQINQMLQAMALQYHSQIEQKDFSNSVQTANEINHFVEQNTNGLIKNLVTPSIFNANTRLFLLNTLYFKADWDNQFDESNVYKKHFYGIDGHTYSIDFMNKEGFHNFYYSRELRAWSLKLDYVSTSNSKFIIILPDEDTNINEVKNKLNPTNLNEVFRNYQPKRSKIFIPKFEIESEIDGVTELRRLGLNSMFDKPHIVALQPGPYLQVSDAKQKAKIIVNSKGTEAAAASYIGVSLHSMPQPFDEFHVNHPFIYLIVTADTNEPLFIGHYTQPGRESFVN